MKPYPPAVPWGYTIIQATRAAAAALRAIVCLAAVSAAMLSPYAAEYALDRYLTHPATSDHLPPGEE